MKCSFMNSLKKEIKKNSDASQSFKFSSIKLPHRFPEGHHLKMFFYLCFPCVVL